MIKIKYNYKGIILDIHLSDECTSIIDSYRIISKKDMKSILLDLQSKDDLAVNKRSIKSMVREWASHNLLYNLNICINRTKSVDLNYPTKWYSELGYFILSLFYCK